MAPAGYWPQLHAAIEAGADSVYFGLKHFTARAKVGFSLEELPEVMRTLHRRGVKGFVTFNTLVFDHELAEAARALGAIAEAGADAVIIQDIGICSLAHQIAPDLEIHASTQMSITDAEGIRFAQRLGVSRVTLARELSLDEIRNIREAGVDCDLEIFVHGALCVAYSGQCFSSEAWGGRSANRGQCAQACRLPYELIVDNEWRPLGDSRYLLSPGDLYAIPLIKDIVSLGISALKIEGRYKDAGYVALTTRAYRHAVDEAWAGREPSLTQAGQLQLEQVYSRGLGPYFLSGTNHQKVVQGRSPRHRGVCMGSVSRVLPNAILIEPSKAHTVAPLKPGDGVVFDAADWRSPQEDEEGGRVYGVEKRGNAIAVSFGNHALNTARIRPGDLVWRTHDPELDKAVRPFLSVGSHVSRQPLHVKVTAREGAPLRSEWLVGLTRIEILSDEPLVGAQNRGLDEVLLREQFGRLGNTAYELASLQLSVEGKPFAPASLLNQMRRTAVERLQAEQGQLRPASVRDPVGNLQRAIAQVHPDPASVPLQLHLLVRTAEQLEAALECRPASITLDYLDLYGLKPSVERVKASGIAVRVAAPRIIKPGEERVVNFLVKLGAPILVRSAGLLEQLKGVDLTGDFSLNAANVLTGRILLDAGLRRITPTHDLNAAQVAELARELGGSRIEAIVYGHLPVFHTEHCVFCRFLSDGTTYKDCGRPCEVHRVALRDQNGREHPVMADVGCRNTVFGAEAQVAAQHWDLWREAGIAHFRLEFVHESAREVTLVSKAFRESKTAAQLDEELKRIAPQGTTQGSLFVPSNYLSLPILQ